MSILRPSNWSYKTGATGGVSIEFVVASGGTIVLADPAGKETDFYYGGVGVGIGFGLRVPKIKLPQFSLPEIKIPKIARHEVGGAASAKSFDSAGLIYMAPAFHGTELAESDFQGATVYLDGGVGIGYGKAGSAMILGINSPRSWHWGCRIPLCPGLPRSPSRTRRRFSSWAALPLACKRVLAPAFSSATCID